MQQDEKDTCFTVHLITAVKKLVTNDIFKTSLKDASVKCDTSE